MTQHEIYKITRKQLATDLNCTVDELCGEKDSFVFVRTADNAGRRPFPRGEHHFETLTMGNSIVVSATPELMSLAKPQLTGKTRDEAFSMPFVRGHSIYYLPDLSILRTLEEPSGFEYELIERDSIPELYKTEGF